MMMPPSRRCRRRRRRRRPGGGEKESATSRTTTAHSMASIIDTGLGKRSLIVRANVASSLFVVGGKWAPLYVVVTLCYFPSTPRYVRGGGMMVGWRSTFAWFLWLSLPGVCSVMRDV